MVTVSYLCSRCGAVAELEPDTSLEDECVTAAPLEGWEYADAWDDFDDADGVVIVCGAAEIDGEGCGEPYYLSVVRFEDAEEVDPGLPAEGPRFDFLR